jgi:hypothetical protein
MCCPKASSEFATSDFCQIDSAPLDCLYAGSCWQQVRRHSPHRQTPARVHPLGTAHAAALLWSWRRDSPPQKSRGAVTSIPHNAAASCDPAMCAQHARGLVCSEASCQSKQRLDRTLPPEHTITVVPLQRRLPPWCLPVAESTAGLAVPMQPSIPIAAASAANASGFLQVSLSKTPRLAAHVFAPVFVHRGVSDEG